MKSFVKPLRNSLAAREIIVGRLAGSLWLTSILAASAVSAAPPLVKLDFSKGYEADKSLIGQSSGGDLGVVGTFIDTKDANVDSSETRDTGHSVTVVPTTSATSLTYRVKNGGTIEGGGNAVRFDVASGPVEDIFKRPLKSALTGKTFYVRVLIRQLTAEASTETDLIFGLAGSNLLQAAGFGIYHAKVGATLSGLGQSEALSTQALKPSASNLLVAKFEWNGTRYQSVSVWLNPAADAEKTPDATIKDPNGVVSITELGLGCANMLDNSRYLFGSWLISTQWSDVVPNS